VKTSLKRTKERVEEKVVSATVQYRGCR
jgi:hypothetical protein